jgi:uncharacterized membrane protein
MPENTLLDWIELTVTAVEFLAVIIIVITIIIATVRYIYGKLFQSKVKGFYQKYRRSLAKAILMGLEILIAADVIRTVALDRTIQAIIVLGLLVAIRIILSWSLLVEINNHWPWQKKTESTPVDEEI